MLLGHVYDKKYERGVIRFQQGITTAGYAWELIKRYCDLSRPISFHIWATSPFEPRTICYCYGVHFKKEYPIYGTVLDNVLVLAKDKTQYYIPIKDGLITDCQRLVL